MASLFGPTPQEIIYARMKEDEKMRMLRDQQISQEGSQFGVFAPLYQAGRRFGEMGSKAIVSGLFPEAVSPDLRKAQMTQAILAKYEGQDLGDPANLKKIGSEFLTAGVPEAGIKALALSKDLMPKEKKINEIGKTPKGIQVYQEGDTQFYLENGQRVPYYGTLRQETVAPTGTKQFGNIQGLRKDYLTETKAQFEGYSALDSAKKSLSQLTGIGDEVAKRKLLKANGESGSGLSNKDVASFANFGPLGQRIAGKINQLLEGTYTDEQRKEIVQLIEELQKQIEDETEQRRTQYRDMGASIEGITPKDLDFIAPSLSSIYRSGIMKTIPSEPTQAALSGTGFVTTRSGKKFRELP